MIVNEQVAGLIRSQAWTDVPTKATEKNKLGKTPYGPILIGELPDGVCVQGTPEEVAYLVGCLREYVDVISRWNMVLLGESIKVLAYG